jgi:hypothetical protein
VRFRSPLLRVAEPDTEPTLATGSNGRASETHPLLRLLAPQAERYARVLATRAYEAGLAVTQADGHTRPIPIGALPQIVDDADIEHRAAVAARLVAATARAARWRLAGAGRDATLAALGAAERRLVAAGTEHDDLAVARVDFLAAPMLQALEVNATIPAMQGYSDIAAESWLRTVASDRADLSALLASNGSNAAALLQALLDLHLRRRGRDAGHVALLCRRGDAQISELAWLRDRFRAAGVDADVVHPDQLRWDGRHLIAGERPLPLVYRHLFLSRLDASPSPAIEAAMRVGADAGTLVLNRAAPHLEMKSTLALLSRSAESESLAETIGLEPDEREAIRAALPWTRTLTAPSGAESRRLLDAVAAAPDAYVLKRSWSYGGSDVFVGRARGSDEFQRRMRAAFPGANSWSDLCAHAASDTRGGGFVVQRAVERAENEQLLCTPSGAQRARVITDYAAFASLGTTPAWSGVARAAASDVVNIVGGGAVVPILRRSVADRLAATIGGEPDACAGIE